MTAAPARLLTVPFALAFVASFLTGLSFHGFLHLPGFLQELGASEVEIGVIIGTMSAVAIAARPVVGWLMDVRGRRVVVLGGAILTAVASLLYLPIESLGPAIYGVRLVHGLAGAAMFSVLFTIAADVSPPARRTQGIALFGISGMLPLSLGGLMGDWILSWGSYDDLFLATGGLAVLALLTALPIPDSRPAADRDAPASRGFVATLRSPDLLPLWWVGVCFAIGITSYFTFMKTFVLARHVGTVGLFFTAYAATAILERLFLGWVPDRYGPKRVLIPSLFALAGGLVVLAGADSAFEVGLSGALAGAGHGYAFPIISALVVDRASAAERGVAVSIFTALFDAGLLLGSPTLGAILQASSYGVMFAVAAAITVFGGLTFLLWDRDR